MTTANLDPIDPQKYLTEELVKQCTMEELSMGLKTLVKAREVLLKRYTTIYGKARDLYEAQYPGKAFIHLEDDLKDAWYSEAAHKLEEEG